MRLDEFRNQIYSCLRCGFCFDHIEGGGQKICPPYATHGFESYGARGKMALARALIDRVIEYDADIAARVYACTECGACQEECFKYLSLAEIYAAMKGDLAERDLLPDGRKSLLAPLDGEGNPYGRPSDRRLAWAPGTERVGRTADVVLYAGCTPSYVRRGIARSAFRLLDAAGVDFALLGEEVCCGHPHVSMGRPDLAVAGIEHNLAAIERAGAKTVVFACPGCLKAFREELPRLLGRLLPFEALHLSEFLAESSAFRAVRLQKQSRIAAYHDPCTLGRGLGIFEPPRRVIEAVPSSRLVEMPRTRERSFCCGNGGFVRFDDEAMSVENEISRFAEAERTGAEVVLSACPACQIGLLDAKRREDSPIEVLDILEWVAAAL